MYIDDCVEAFSLEVSRLAKSVIPWSPSALTFSSRPSFEAFNAASGESAKASSGISILVYLTHSQSPIQIIGGDTRFPNVYKGSTVKANTVLGLKAKVAMREGLRKFVTAYRRRTSAFLEESIKSSCGPRTGLTATVNAGEERPSMQVVSRFAVNSQQLDKLNGCSVHVVMNIDGELATLGPIRNPAVPCGPP